MNEKDSDESQCISGSAKRASVCLVDQLKSINSYKNLRKVIKNKLVITSISNRRKRNVIFSERCRVLSHKTKKRTFTEDNVSTLVSHALTKFPRFE